jgi:branched-chain amino acid aminotransferase
LHYGQIVFEGLKAHRTADGSVAVFRPDAYARRMRRSARRFAMPEPPDELFVAAVAGVTEADQESLPVDDESASLYLRPLLVASEPSLALRPARSYLFVVIAFVTGGFFSDDPEPIQVWIEEEYVRAAPGGVGAAKCAGNYAATYAAQMAAAARGSDQVVWLDAVHRRFVEEMGTSNLFFVYGTGDRPRVTTPPLTGTVLPGITRDCLLTLARDHGYEVAEEPMEVERWRADARSGALTEVFACGTASTVTPVGVVDGISGSWRIGDGTAGPVTLRLRNALRLARQGRDARYRDWLHPVRRRAGSEPR